MTPKEKLRAIEQLLEKEDAGTWSDNPDFVVYDYSDSNVDDAFEGGEREGRVLLSRDIRSILKHEIAPDERIHVGDIYEDCAYHPVRCTHVDYVEDDIRGVSLIDGSTPRSCSLYNCGVVKLTEKQAADRVKLWQEKGPQAVYNTPLVPD